MSATTAALEVVEASLDEQLDDWCAANAWQHRLENTKAGVRMYTDGSEIELSGIRVRVPWSWRRRLRAAVERWAARKAVSRFKGTESDPDR